MLDLAEWANQTAAGAGHAWSRPNVGPRSCGAPVSWRPVDEAVGEHVELWLAVVEGNAEAWFALVSAEGFGRDNDVARLVDHYRDATVERIVDALGEAGVVPNTAIPRAPPSSRFVSSTVDPAPALSIGTADMSRPVAGRPTPGTTARARSAPRAIRPPVAGTGRRRTGGRRRRDTAVTRADGSPTA